MRFDELESMIYSTNMCAAATHFLKMIRDSDWLEPV